MFVWVLITKCCVFLCRYEIRDTHLVEENVLQVLKDRADFDSYKPRPFNMREFYDRTGHDIKDMLLSCSFRGMECSAEDFKVVSHRCQQFHLLCRPDEALRRRGSSERVCNKSLCYDLRWAIVTEVCIGGMIHQDLCAIELIFIHGLFCGAPSVLHQGRTVVYTVADTHHRQRNTWCGDTQRSVSSAMPF